MFLEAKLKTTMLICPYISLSDYYTSLIKSVRKFLARKSGFHFFAIKAATQNPDSILSRDN